MLYLKCCFFNLLNTCFCAFPALDQVPRKRGRPRKQDVEGLRSEGKRAAGRGDKKAAAVAVKCCETYYSCVLLLMRCKVIFARAFLPKRVALGVPTAIGLDVR